MATHSSILAWRIPWREKPGGFTVHGVAQGWTWLNIALSASSPFSLWWSQWWLQAYFFCRVLSVLHTWWPTLLYVFPTFTPSLTLPCSRISSLFPLSCPFLFWTTFNGHYSHFLNNTLFQVLGFSLRLPLDTLLLLRANDLVFHFTEKVDTVTHSAQLQPDWHIMFQYMDQWVFTPPWGHSHSQSHQDVISVLSRLVPLGPFLFCLIQATLSYRVQGSSSLEYMKLILSYVAPVHSAIFVLFTLYVEYLLVSLLLQLKHVT